MAGRTRRDLESEFQDVLKAEPASAEHGNDLPEPLRSKQRRSSPAEVDRVNGKRQQPCRAVAELNASFLIGSRQLGDLLLKRVRVGIKDARRRHSRAEITEGAFGGTERDLNVDAQIVHTRLTVYRVQDQGQSAVSLVPLSLAARVRAARQIRRKRRPGIVR